MKRVEMSQPYYNIYRGFIKLFFLNTEIHIMNLITDEDQH